MTSDKCNTSVPLTRNIWFGSPLPSQGNVSITGPNNLNPGQTGVFNISTTSFNFVSSFNWVLFSNVFPNAQQHFDLNQVHNGLFTVKPDFDVPGGIYTVQARATNACGFYPVQKSIDVEGGDGIPVLYSNSNLYKIYPNPSSSYINISLVDQSQMPTVSNGIFGELLDLNGTFIKNVGIQNNQATVQTNDLKKGIYILRIHYDGKTEGHQVMVE